MASLKEKGNKAQEIYKKLEELNVYKNNIYWKQAEFLYQLKKDNLYRFVFGEETQSWSSFLSEIKIPLSSADQKVCNWDFFIKKHSLSPSNMQDIDTSCLYYITAYSKDKDTETIKEQVDCIKHMSRGDFIATIKGIDCLHDGEILEDKNFKCKKCGRKLGNKHTKTNEEK